ncbi:MAG: tRNA (uridine(54)-C5)-methyltransferase TrmA [Campylobacteraceae bacterium 4484_4]|nr:MAG: tRNA (uridine(54)-C5)-methyltransferase TrmA [Campylobacteraceae bacterium 4484_4]
MTCDAFGKCGSCTLWEYDYESQLRLKTERIREMFNLERFDIVRSQPDHFRTRAEFRIYHENGCITYAMHPLEGRGLVPIRSCSIVAPKIAEIMPKLIDKISSSSLLKERLFATEFLSSSLGELLVTLIYHKKIDEKWEEEAKKLAEELQIDLIGRSRGIKRIVTKEYIDEALTIEGQTYRYRLYDTGFTQPNTGVNSRMIEWVLAHLGTECSDLLELYCGHGNFTLPLSRRFEHVLATEISKHSIRAAIENARMNGITHIDFVRLSSEELTRALRKERTFNRLEGVDLDRFDFSHVFVDPPRAGLDTKSLAFISRFPHIIYISCNPETLRRDLESLLRGYKIDRFAIFDQFPYTRHLESGVILSKI